MTGAADRSQPVVAGIVTALVGFSSTFALVLAGLRAVGASEDEAASGLLVLCLTMGVVAIALSLRTRMPISIAWSTPGAALLLSSGAVPGGYAAAVGAFAFAGALTVVTSLSGRLERLIAAIPAPIASAMLAGVLLPVCVAPAQAVVEIPELAAAPVAVWALLAVVARRWAVPGSLLVTIAVILIGRTPDVGAPGELLPVLTFTAPAFSTEALIGLGLPLFVVTMASQNVPGMGVLAGFGYRPRLRPILASTGAASAVGAPFGGHAINLAAISAALAAGPEAGPDTERRWIASSTAGVSHIALGLSAGAATVLVAAAPPLLIGAVAGLALLGTLAASLQAALADEHLREPAIVCFAVSASAITAFGVSAPFWGLVAGLGFLALRRSWRPPRSAA